MYLSGLDIPLLALVNLSGCTMSISGVEVGSRHVVKVSSSIAVDARTFFLWLVALPLVTGPSSDPSLYTAQITRSV